MFVCVCVVSFVVLGWVKELVVDAVDTSLSVVLVVGEGVMKGKVSSASDVEVGLSVSWMLVTGWLREAFVVESFKVVPIESVKVVPVESFKVLDIESFKVVLIESVKVLPVESFKVVPVESFKVVPVESFKVLDIESVKVVLIESVKVLPVESFKVVPVESFKVVPVESFKVVTAESFKVVLIESFKVVLERSKEVIVSSVSCVLDVESRYLVVRVVETETDNVESCTVSKVSTELVSPGSVVDWKDGLLDTSVELSVVIIDVPPMGLRLDGVFVPVVGSRA